MAERSGRLVSPEQMEEQRMYMAQVHAMAQRPRSFHVVTYGCQMNAHDSEYLAGMLREMGMDEAPDRAHADFVLFNTCCVRDNAERRALGNVTWLKELRKQNPRLMIGVCGCMIQQPGMAERILQQYRFVDLAFGTANLYRLPEMMLHALTSDRAVVEVEEQDVIPENMPVKRLRQDAAYITIMYGCDNFCSYCVVPYVRGRERSREMDAILREAEALQQSGVKEIMLLGQNVNSYGKGLSHGESFAQLLRRLDSLGIERIRFMTSHPKDLSDELIDVMGTSRHVLPQFHLPVQSGNDEILRRMNRHYDRARYLDRVDALRRTVPGIGLTTDIIVAFPGETEAEYQQTRAFIEEIGFARIHVFPFSPREGTKAAQMIGQLSREEKERRARALIALGEEVSLRYRQGWLNREAQVLLEEPDSQGGWLGYTPEYIQVTVPACPACCQGAVLPVRLTAMTGDGMAGELLPA